jgi:hypothetical protein
VGRKKKHGSREENEEEEDELTGFREQVEDVTKDEIDAVWSGIQSDGMINLRRFCRRHGFFPHSRIILNRRYSNFPECFSYYSQRLRVVGMSYQRTMFAGAFLSDGDVDGGFVKMAFENTHRWLFDDAFYFIVRPGCFGFDEMLKAAMQKTDGETVQRKVLFFMDEIKQNLDDDLTLTELQKDLFLHYFSFYHQRIRGCFSLLYLSFYWSLFLFLVCLFFSFDFLFMSPYITLSYLKILKFPYFFNLSHFISFHFILFILKGLLRLSKSVVKKMQCVKQFKIFSNLISRVDKRGQIKKNLIS